MARIRLIAFDLDGTVLNSQLRVSPTNYQALAAAGRQGIWLVPATSRPISFVRPLADRLRLSDPLICNNGALVLGSSTGPVWAAQTLPDAIARLVARLADEQGWKLSITTAETVHVLQRPGQPLVQLQPGWVIMASHMAGLAAAEAQGGPLKMMSWDQATIIEIGDMVNCGLLPGCHLVSQYCPDGIIESAGLFPVGAALQLVMRHLGLAKEKVMAIGDNANDLALFAAAGLAVAMSNGIAAAKAAADAIAPSNDANGLAWAINRFALAAPNATS